jgi:hypothetical protein
VASRATPLTRLLAAKANRDGRAGVPNAAHEHGAHDASEIEHVMEALNPNFAKDAALDLEIVALAVPHEPIDHVEQREQNAAHEQHRPQHGLKRQRGGRAEWRQGATDIAGEKDKDTNTWVL